MTTTEARLAHALNALHEREVLAQTIRTQYGTSKIVQCILDAFMIATDPIESPDGFCCKVVNESILVDVRRVFEDDRVREIVQALRATGFIFNVRSTQGQVPFCEISLKKRSFRLVHPDGTYTSIEPPSESSATSS
jgi:hypothetical protein